MAQLQKDLTKVPDADLKEHLAAINRARGDIQVRVIVTPWRALETATTSLVERLNDRVGRDHQNNGHGNDNWRHKPNLHRMPLPISVKLTFAPSEAPIAY